MPVRIHRCKRTSWQDVWLNEGFASYCQWMWYEHTNGRARFAALIDQQYQLLAERRIGPPAAVPQEDMFGAAVYVRGAMALHALRLEVGDETFRAIVQEYYQRFKGHSVFTSDFIAVANHASNRDLSSFLKAWLLERALPPLPASTP